MLKMCKRIRNNNGSSVVELSIIMPFIIMVLMLIIFLFVDAINDGKIMGCAYSLLYTYDEAEDSDSGIELKNGELSIMSDKLDALYESGIYTYDKRNVKYSTEYGKCTDRLRRWQLYGDAVSKYGD